MTLMMEINQNCPIIAKYHFEQTFEGGGGRMRSPQGIKRSGAGTENVERERCVDHLSLKFS